MPNIDQSAIVLGADGFIGRHLVEYWRERGWPVHPVGRAAGDFTDPAVATAALRDAPRADRILHAITRQRTGAIQYEMQGELLADNARIHLNILDAWHKHQPQAKLISLGSSCVYPESDRPVPETEFRSGAPHPSVRGYALAKEVLAVGSETYGKQYGLRWLHCILATVYGPRAHTEPNRSHFMPALIARAVASSRAGAASFDVWGSLDTVRDLLFVTDQIEAIVAADAMLESCIVNCASNAPVTIGECARAVLVALEWSAPITQPKDSFQGASFKSIDSTRFLSATGWRPGIGLADGIRRVLNSDFAAWR